MFLNSSKSMKSKIIEAAIKTDEDYRMHRRAKENKSRKACIISSSDNLSQCHLLI